ncbi:MAG: hypothetical protein ACYCW6_30385 [Candidatus Xenobia bacterium]
MRPAYVVYFLLVALVAFLVELPREQIVRWYIDRTEQSSGTGLSWQKGIFTFRSAWLDGVDVIANHRPVCSLDALNATIGVDGSVSFRAMRGKGTAWGSVSRSDLAFNTDAFPVPGIPPAVFTDLTVKTSGHLDLSHHNGTGTFDATAMPGDLLATMLHVAGKLNATGDYTIKGGGAEIHATLAGDKLTGRLDVTATAMPGNGQPMMLEGALNADVNGQPHNFRITGTSLSPSLTQAPTAGPGAYPFSR